MSTTVAKSQNRQVANKPDARQFRGKATQIANALLKDWVGEHRAAEASGRIATALSASAASARNPDDFYACTPQSIAKVVAISALTGIMVSTGQGALAYAIPRRPRKNDPPQLQYQLSHRGIAALAKRAGLSLVAYPISTRDQIDTDEAGEVVVRGRDIDNPPTCEEDLRGVMVLVRSIETGVVLSRGWVPKSVILDRRETSDSYNYAVKNSYAQATDPWHKWFVEMAIKTAMHYAVGRGWCVIDDSESVQAIQADSDGDFTPVHTVAIEDHSATDSLTDQLLGGDSQAEPEPEPEKASKDDKSA